MSQSDHWSSSAYCAKLSDLFSFIYLFVAFRKCLLLLYSYFRVLSKQVIIILFQNPLPHWLLNMWKLKWKRKANIAMPNQMHEAGSSVSLKKNNTHLRSQNRLTASQFMNYLCVCSQVGRAQENLCSANGWRRGLGCITSPWVSCCVTSCRPTAIEGVIFGTSWKEESSCLRLEATYAFNISTRINTQKSAMLISCPYCNR